MTQKAMIFLITAVLALALLAGCEPGTDTVSLNDTAVVAVAGDTIQASAEMNAADALVPMSDAAPAEPAASDAINAATVLATNSGNHAESSDTAYQNGETIAIALNGDSIAVNNPAVTVDGTRATITNAGTYSLSGVLSDGQIVVDTDDEAGVQIILAGVDITSSTSSPIAIMDAAEVTIVLASNTENRLTDGSTYILEDPESDEPNAAVYSTADLTLTGDGSLVVTGNTNDGIAGKDGLVIAGGTITVSAVDDGIRGKDYLVIRDGNLNINAGGDGLKADNEEDATMGYIAIEDGNLTIDAGGDAIQAQTDVVISGGVFNLTSGGGNAGQIAADDSAKGIKGVVTVAIDGGTFTIDSADDAIHSNAALTINGGIFNLATGDDALHADSTLTINEGDIRVTQSYEGIESAVITINGGNIDVVAGDDGINVAGGADGSGMMAGPGHGGRPPRGGTSTQESFTYTGSYYLYINGGTITVDAAGDGIDANGAIEMTNGVVLVSGPTEQMNAALDYDATFNISGGLLVMAGSAGMAQAPSGTSTQNSVLINLSSTLPGGTLINIRNASGESILTFAPSKDYQSIAFSSPDLVNGDYTITYDGSSSGTIEDGLYLDGVYTPGTEYASFTVSGVTTTLGGGGFR